MTPIKLSQSDMKVLNEKNGFDPQSGSIFERLIFNNRLTITIVCMIITAFLGWRASMLEINASFERMMPQSHPYIRNYMGNVEALRALGNSIRVVVENKNGSIYDPQYLDTLQKVSDKLYLMPGVDRSFMKSLWTPTVRWTETTEEGFKGGPVMPDSYDGSAESIALLRSNVLKAGVTGSLVANNEKSSLVFVPLLDTDTETGKPRDYRAFSKLIEQKIRSADSDTIQIHVVGFAKLVGDLMDGLQQVMRYFAVAAAITGIVIYLYTRCIRSALLILICSAVAVSWQLGIMQLLSFTLDPYSVLVPFLIFAIGVSHGAQKMNGIMQDIGRGTHKYIAARYTFRRLFLTGLTALLADAVGFAVLMLIDIPVIQALALSASIGVAVLVFTNLLFLPILLSYTGVSESAARRSIQEEDEVRGGKQLVSRIIAGLDKCTTRRWATVVVALSAVLFLGGLAVSSHLKIGDIDPGAPELRADSRYNKDIAFVTEHYALSNDQFAVIVKTEPGGIETFPTLIEMDRLGERLRTIGGVQSVTSVASIMRIYTSGSFEGNPKWMTISRDPFVSGDAFSNVIVGQPELANQDRTVAPVLAFLKDHKAETLDAVVKAVESFAVDHNQPGRQFLLAAGTAGIEAATNIVVKKANRDMLILVYAAICLLCLITFRSWRAMLVAVIPLVLTTVLCEALMVYLGIGVKVATLPVIALGVGIGVDYSLYLLSVQLSRQRQGICLQKAFADALTFTGKVVALVGMTLAAGVMTWVLSPIKFQADMGILLTFMFLWNMVGALVLIPALSHFLLPDSSFGVRTTAPAEIYETHDASQMGAPPRRA